MDKTLVQVDLPKWLSYIEKHIGVVLPKTSHQWLVHPIRQIAQTYDMTVDDLFVAMRTNDVIKQALIDEITIAESRFFRDESAIAFIGELYQAYLTKNMHRPFVVVSLGCSTGQELWSIGMTCETIFLQQVNQRSLSNVNLDNHPRNYRLIGLDINQKNLAIAKRAQYHNDLLQEIDARFYATLEDVPSELGMQWRPKQVWQANAEFAVCNLFHPDDLNDVLMRMNIQPHVVICQNVLIYFRRFDQRDMLSRMANILADEGYLILGAAEGLFWQDMRMKKMDHATVNAWQKHDDAHGAKAKQAH